MCLLGIVGRLQTNDSFDKGNHYYTNTLGEVSNYTIHQHQILTQVISRRLCLQNRSWYLLCNRNNDVWVEHRYDMDLQW